MNNKIISLYRDRVVVPPPFFINQPHLRASLKSQKHRDVIKDYEKRINRKIISVSGILGSLCNDDSDSNENVKKSNRLNNQNNNSARALHFWVHFFGVNARLGREISWWDVLSRTKTHDE